MDYLKKLSFWLLLSYIILISTREPSLADGIVVLCLSALFGYEQYLSNGKLLKNLPLDSNSILEDQLKEEQLKLRIHEVKSEYMRKSASSIIGGDRGRPTF